MRSKALQPLIAYLKASPPGRSGRLPPERDLAAAIGVSRQALRRALALLESEGRLERRVGAGTFYLGDAERPGDAKPGAADLAFDLGVPTNPLEVMEVRMMIEPQCARWAALRASQADIARMASCLAKMRDSEDWRDYDEWDGALHRAICVATRNQLLLMLFDGFNEARRQMSWGELRLQALKGDWREKYHLQHDGIVDAIARRAAPLAEQRMREHLETIRQDLFAGMDR